MGRKLVLTGVTLTDLDAPMLVNIDPIESAGSLLLIDPTHPYSSWAAGVPANAAVIPNLLKDTLSTGDASFLLGGAINNGTKGTFERTANGGLHGIVSQANALASGDGARIKPASALFAYLFANLSHDYYLSFWDRYTRVNPTPASYTEDYATGANTSFGVVFHGSQGWNGLNSIIGSRAAANVVGNRHGSAAVVAATASSAASFDGTGLPVWGAPTGTHSAAVIGTRNNKWPSLAFYRVYLEDLTVSGRTYAEVDALDHALYTTEVLTAGGRYYGDTMTAVATIP